MTEQLQSKRIEGLDFARALAMFGMLIVNFKIIMGATGRGPDWLIWFTELLKEEHLQLLLRWPVSELL